MNDERKWALYSWLPGSDDHFIYPDDLKIASSILPYGKVLRVVGSDGPYLVMEYGASRFRGRGDLARWIDAPEFWIGDHVKIADKGEVGIVVDVGWHHKNRRPMYFLLVDGKRRGRRYDEQEFVRL